MTWNDILQYLTNGNPSPPKIVDRTNEEWKKILTPEQYYITREKGTEQPIYDSCAKPEKGCYTCVCCGNLLFDVKEKFNSGQGWPSFSQPVIKNCISYHIDNSLGMERVEVDCNVCNAHLGHVFPDGPMPSGLRYCINSIAIKYHASSKGFIETAIFGGGCFWCTEAIFKKINGVISVEPGYAGGFIPAPTYSEVCNGNTGHAEVIKITYEPSLIDYKSLVRIHLSTHDPTTPNSQGNDVGTQYRSIIFYNGEKQKKEAIEEINHLAGIYEYPIITQLEPITKFYPAENYHKDYFEKHPNEPYCKLIISPKIKKFEQVIDTIPITTEDYSD